MRRGSWFDGQPETAGLVVAVVIFTLVVAFGVMLSRYEDQSDVDVLSGCSAPRLRQALPHTSGTKYGIVTTYTYLYDCADGRTVEVYHRVQP